jgi:hypothetical protein
MRRVHIGRTLLVAFLSWLVGLLGSFIPSVKNWPSPLPVLVPPAVALVVALGLAFVQAAIPTSRSQQDEPGSRRGSGLPTFAATLAIVQVLGLGGSSPVGSFERWLKSLDSTSGQCPACPITSRRTP